MVVGSIKYVRLVQISTKQCDFYLQALLGQSTATSLILYNPVTVQCCLIKLDVPTLIKTQLFLYIKLHLSPVSLLLCLCVRGVVVINTPHR